MDEGSRILVKTNKKLEINDCYLSGCDHMWQGIETEASSTLRIYYSFIESANLGVRLGDETSFQCVYNDFIDNYVGISVGSPFEADQFGQQIHQRAQIIGCNFYTHNVVPNPYPGHYYYPSWPTSPSQIPYNQGYAAIFISGSSGLNLGYDGATGSFRNDIYDMRNGVICRNSAIEIKGTDFHDFVGTMVRNPADELLDINQHAIHAYRTTLNVRDVSVSDVMVGSFAEESNTTFRGNTFDILNTGNDLTLTRGLSAIHPHGFIANDNQIDEGFIGIALEKVNNPFSIVDNYFDRTIVHRNNAAISVSELRYGNNEIGEIIDNHIDINDGKAASGIALNEVDFITVEDNDIVYNRVVAGGPWNFNVGINGCGIYNSFFRWNDITAHSDYTNYSENVGISFEDIGFNRLFCNKTDEFYKLKRFIGYCGNTFLIANEFDDGLIGLELQGPTALGPQRHFGNLWNGNSTTWEALISGLGMQGTANNSMFTVDPSAAPLGQFTLPSPIGPNGMIASIWFVQDTGMTLTCETEDDDIAPNPDTLANIILEGFDFDTFNYEMEWMMKADIFNMMLLDTTLEDNTTLDSFFTAEIQNPLGKLVAAHANLDTRYGSKPGLKSDTRDSILTLSEDLTYIDSILSLSPGDSATWISLRALKVDSLSERVLSWIDLIDTEDSTSLITYEEIRDSLEAITPGNDFEEYYRDALIYKADILLGDTIKTSDSTDIADLASLCPWQGGRGLTVAKGLLMMLTDSIWKAEPNDCTDPSPFIVYPKPHTQLDEGHIQTIYPNPSSDVINIVSDAEIEIAEIRSSSNSILNKYNPKSKKLSIDVSSYPAGVYYIITKAGKRIDTRKVVIIK